MPGKRTPSMHALYTIADQIKPNVIDYTRLAAVSPTFYSVFTSDRVWRYLNPYGVESGIFEKFIQVCGQKTTDLRLVKMYWQPAKSLFMHFLPEHNLYIWLAFSLTNSVNAVWGFYNQFVSKDSENPLHDADIRKQIYWCTLNIKNPSLPLSRDQMDLVVKFIEREDFFDTSALQGGDKTQLITMLSLCQTRRRRKFLDKQILEHVSPALYGDAQLMLAAARTSTLALNVADSQLWKEKQFVLDILRIQDPSVLQYIPKYCMEDAEIFELAIELYPEAMKSRSTSPNLEQTNEKLKSLTDKKKVSADDFIELVGVDEANAKPWPSELPKDTTFIKRVLEVNGLTLRYLTPRHLRSDRKLVKAAVTSNGLALQFADPKFHSDEEIVTAAVKNDGRALFHASPSLRENISVVSLAVASHPTAILAASKELQSNREVLKLGFLNGGSEFFSMIDPDMNSRDDEELVLLALKHDPDALLYASTRLAKDPTFTIRALQANGAVYMRLPVELQRSTQIYESIGPVGSRINRNFMDFKWSYPISWAAANSR